jgi:hypothetical protein
MRTAAAFAALTACILLAAPLVVAAHTIPAEKVDRQKIYWGDTSNFEKPGEVDYVDVIKATPEYEELRKKRIESGTARYYYLMTQASERAVRVIVEVGQESEYDLVAAKGYLSALEQPIEAPDLTEVVLARLRGGGVSSQSQ